MKTSSALLNVCVAVAVVAMAGNALAQGQGAGRRGGFGGRGGFNPLMLLQAEPVQKELELSEDQKTSLTKLADENRGGGGGGAQLSPEERQTRRDEIQKKVNEVLLPNQQERFEQIVLQVSMKMQPSQALSDSKVADKLQLTDDQKKQLADLSSDYRQKFMDLFQGGGPPDRDAMAKLRTEQSDKAMAVLTSDQKEQLTKLQGKTVEIDPAQLRGFGRGGRNRGNGGGGGGGTNGKGQPDA
jgi:Spy/CpxP family protein refolding chaperone